MQLTREIKLCYGWTRCGQQFVCAVRLSHILTSFSAKYAPLIVRAALISASCQRKGWANQWWALTLVYLLGNKNIWEDFTSSLGSPSNSISVCAPPLDEFCKLVFIVPLGNILEFSQHLISLSNCQQFRLMTMTSYNYILVLWYGVTFDSISQELAPQLMTTTDNVHQVELLWKLSKKPLRDRFSHLIYQQVCTKHWLLSIIFLHFAFECIWLYTYGN